MKDTKQTASEKRAEVAYSMEQLKKLLKEGDRVYLVLRSVSSSGMSRNFDCYIPGTDYDGKPGIIRITHHVAHVLGYPLTNNGVRIQGCGMDMAFALVYDLAGKLFADGYKLTHRLI